MKRPASIVRLPAFDSAQVFTRDIRLKGAKKLMIPFQEYRYGRPTPFCKYYNATAAIQHLQTCWIPNVCVSLSHPGDPLVSRSFHDTSQVTTRCVVALVYKLVTCIPGTSIRIDFCQWFVFNLAQLVRLTDFNESKHKNKTKTKQKNKNEKQNKTKRTTRT